MSPSKSKSSPSSVLVTQGCRNCGQAIGGDSGRESFRCSRCMGTTLYCSKLCQQTHWKEHKALCRLHTQVEEKAMANPKIRGMDYDLIKFSDLILPELMYLSRTPMRLGRPDALESTHVLQLDFAYESSAALLQDRFTLLRTLRTAVVAAPEAIYRPGKLNQPPKPNESHISYCFRSLDVNSIIPGRLPTVIAVKGQFRFPLDELVPSYGLPHRSLHPHWEDHLRRIMRSSLPRKAGVTQLEDLLESEERQALRGVKGYLKAEKEALASGKDGITALQDEYYTTLIEGLP
ncbi:hypothetical protein RQP46_008566 [Phenoliferia psychrophenolica]